MKTEKCVMCGKETAIEKNTHIDFRPYYVEGAGQCCRECYNKIYEKETIHDVCTEPEKEPKKEPEMNIAKEAILGVYVFGVALFLCGMIDNLSEGYFWLYFGAFAAYALLGYIIFRNSNFKLNNKA